MSPSRQEPIIRGAPSIPDYLIYDEIKRRREEDAWAPERLEMPLYRPEVPAPPPPPDEEDEEPSNRGVMIIDMNDLFDEDEDEDEDD